MQLIDLILKRRAQIEQLENMNELKRQGELILKIQSKLNPRLSKINSEKILLALTPEQRQQKIGLISAENFMQRTPNHAQHASQSKIDQRQLSEYFKKFHSDKKLMTVSFLNKLAKTSSPVSLGAQTTTNTRSDVKVSQFRTLVFPNEPQEASETDKGAHLTKLALAAKSCQHIPTKTPASTA